MKYWYITLKEWFQDKIEEEKYSRDYMHPIIRMIPPVIRVLFTMLFALLIAIVIIHWIVTKIGSLI